MGSIMLRKIIKIDEDKCDGCGLCVSACHEGAIGLVDGKAKLLRDDYCDGLGDCLPACPTGAITFEEREASPYNEEEVKKNMQQQELPCGCPGTHVTSFNRESTPSREETQAHTSISQPHMNTSQAHTNTSQTYSNASQLLQWPVQIKLVPTKAPYFENAALLIAADCAAYAHGGFHNEYMRGRITLIGCPKLDEGDYSEKLTSIIRDNNIKSVTVARMEVPCCGGIEDAVKNALRSSGKLIPWQVVVIGTDGSIVDM